MRSLLAQGKTPFTIPDSCAVQLCRVEVGFSFFDQGRLYNFTATEKVMPEDPYFILVRAAAFSIKFGEPYNGRTPDRRLKDFLIKNNVVI